MAPSIPKQTVFYHQQLTFLLIKLVCVLTLTTFQVTSTHQYRNVHDKQDLDSREASSLSHFSSEDNVPVPAGIKNEEDSFSENADSNVLHGTQGESRVDAKSNRKEYLNDSAVMRYANCSVDRPCHQGYLKRTGQRSTAAFRHIDRLCWLKALATTAVVSTSPVLVLLLIPLQKTDKHKQLQKLLLSFATGGLLGDAFFHMIPHAIMSPDLGDAELVEQWYSHTDGHSHVDRHSHVDGHSHTDSYSQVDAHSHVHGHSHANQHSYTDQHSYENQHSHENENSHENQHSHEDQHSHENQHSHEDQHSHGHQFHSHDMKVGLCILSGVIGFLIAEKLGRFLKYGHQVSVAPDSFFRDNNNSVLGNKTNSSSEDFYTEKESSLKKIEHSPSKKSNTNKNNASFHVKTNSTKRDESISPLKNSKRKGIENSLLEKNNTERIEFSSSERKIKRNYVENASLEEPHKMIFMEDSSLRKRKGRGKNANHKSKNKGGEKCAERNEEMEHDIRVNNRHGKIEIHSKHNRDSRFKIQNNAEHRNGGKHVLLKKIKETETVSTVQNPDIKVIGYLTLVADFAYNFTDGLAIGSSFLAGGSLGAVASLVIFLHELSHEVGDFAILVRSGYSKGKAVFLQLFTAVGSLLGTVCSLTMQGTQDSATAWILPFTAGGFIYIALVSVIPDLLEKSRTWQSIKEILAMITGVLLMVLIALYEKL